MSYRAEHAAVDLAADVSHAGLPEISPVDSNATSVGALILDALVNYTGIAYASLPIPQDVLQAKAKFSELVAGDDLPSGYTFWKRTHLGLRLRREMSIFEGVVRQQQDLLKAITGRAAFLGSVVYNYQAPGAVGDEHYDGFLSIVYGSGDVSINHKSKRESDAMANNAEIYGTSIAVVNGMFPRFLGGERRVVPRHRFDNPSVTHSRDSMVFSYYLAPFTKFNRSKR